MTCHDTCILPHQYVTYPETDLNPKVSLSERHYKASLLKTAHRKLPTPPPLSRTSTPTKLTPISTPTSQSQSSDFLYENQSPPSVNPITLSSQSQDPNMSEVQPTRSETDILNDNNMETETDPLSASITQINLSGIAQTRTKTHPPQRDNPCN